MYPQFCSTSTFCWWCTTLGQDCRLINMCRAILCLWQEIIQSSFKGGVGQTATMVTRQPHTTISTPLSEFPGTLQHGKPMTRGARGEASLSAYWKTIFDVILHRTLKVFEYVKIMLPVRRLLTLRRRREVIISCIGHHFHLKEVWIIQMDYPPGGSRSKLHSRHMASCRMLLHQLLHISTRVENNKTRSNNVFVNLRIQWWSRVSFYYLLWLGSSSHFICASLWL